MTNASVKLRELSVELDDLLLDPNNPRFARSLNLEAPVPDDRVEERQKAVRLLFGDEVPEAEDVDEDDSGNEQAKIRIGDLLASMQRIGFVPIDRIVVRALAGQSKGRTKYVVIEGNRRVAAAKYLRDEDHSGDAPKKKQEHEEILKTLETLDVLLLDTTGLTEEQIHEQVGVILGLRHFGSVLEWGPLAKAVNVFNEYMNEPPALQKFVFQVARKQTIAARLSEAPTDVISALKTYLAFRQLQTAFPDAPPRPSHYSLVQECVGNKKLATAGFIDQDKNTFELSAATLESLNTVCEFATRDGQGAANILREPKSVRSFALLVSDASGHADGAVRSFAAGLRDAVIARDRTLDDAVANLRSFKIDRTWTVALNELLQKVVEPDTGGEPSDSTRLELGKIGKKGNDQIRLAEARAAFKNVRLILGV